MNQPGIHLAAASALSTCPRSLLTECLQKAKCAATNGHGLAAKERDYLREVGAAVVAEVACEESRHRNLEPLFDQPRDNVDRRIAVTVLDLRDELGG